MKNAALIFFLALGIFASVRLHSQNKPPENSGAVLIRVKANNALLLERQAVLLKVLDAMQAEAQQLRIVAKRG